MGSSIPDNVLDIERYRLVRADHPNNIKRGGACIYYKESLPVRVINIPYIKEALLLEMNYNNKKAIISVICRSPSQSTDEFESFLLNFEQLLDDVSQCRPSLSIITGDFNARSVSWWSNDINTTEGLKLSSMSSSVGFTQLINEPTHIQSSSSSCIDFIFTDQPNLSVNCGVQASLHPNCHHQIVYSRFNLDIYYPPPYQRLIWDYKKADATKIRKALDSVNWEKLFDKKNVNAQVLKFSETTLNVFRNYVPSKYLTIDDKDPAWMNETIKSKIKIKNKIFKEYIQNGRFASDFVFLESLIIELNELIYEKDIWKRSNIIPVHKKNYKRLVNSYRPISLLPIFGKIFEKIMFNRVYKFLSEERLLNPNQSGFRPSDSCINQLLAITHEIFEAFDCNSPLEVTSVFLDISKAFDKVWHEGLIYKIKSMGISGELCKLLENYLSGRYQRVVLNGQTSSWRPVLAGVPQGSILGPLLFLIYFNDLLNDLKSNAKLFADDTSLFTIEKDKKESANILNNDLLLISRWAYNWKMLFNPDPTKPA